jgi:DNA-binding transcriptional ArsR family regulator
MHTTSLLSFTEENPFKTTSLLLRSVAHPLRIKMLNFIGQNQPVKVKSIYKELKIEQSIASQHLRVLKDNQVVIYTRKGKEIYYSLHINNLSKIAATVNKHFAIN